jgi:Putative zinc-finger
MNCELIAELLPDYLQGAVSREQAALVDQHLSQCANCAADVAFWHKLSTLPVEQPSTESRARLEAMLRDYTANAAAQSLASTPVAAHPGSGWSFGNWFRSPLAALAWSFALLLLGVFVGSRINVRDTSGRSEEIAAMHSELSSMRQLVVLSMLQQQSASERLQGVTFSRREDQLDPQVLGALLRTLRYDNSVDVRLAALDALSRHVAQPQVRKNVLDALQAQQSPLVQVALIDLLAEWRGADVAQRLRDFQHTPNLNPAVRQRAEWAVSTLN